MLTLRSAVEADAALAIALHCDAAVARWLWSERRNFAEANEWFMTMLHSTVPPGGAILAVEEDRKIIGFVWFTQFMGPQACMSMGFVRHRGQGLAAGVARLGIDYAFETLQLHRLTATAAEANEPARRLCERYGILEGRLRQAWEYPAGEFLDVLVYGLLAKDWAERPTIQEPESPAAG